jgi:hypothetical protein
MLHRGDPLAAMMAASVGVAKYEQAFRSIVWRIDQLPKRDQGAYKTHIFECRLTIPSYDPIPEKFEPIADVEYSMSQAFISHCQVNKFFFFYFMFVFSFYRFVQLLYQQLKKHLKNGYVQKVSLLIHLI